MENNSETRTTSSTDSWMFVKNDKIGKDPVEKEDLEDSDGISVISESEMLKNNSNHQSDDDNVEKPVVEEVEEEESTEEVEEAKEVELLTPPATPSDEIEEKCEEVTSKELAEINQENPVNTTKEQHSHGAVLLIAMGLIIALLYTNISSLKKEFAKTTSMYEHRIANLEMENQQLKAQLNELIIQLRSNDEIIMPLNSEKIDEILLEEKFIERQEEANRKPITKDVWLGGEKEDVVKILDKKYNSLPDYCYFTDESDLFYEYNKEACERKKKKLDERVKKFHEKNDQQAESIDDSIYSTTKRDKDYDDFMRQTREKLLASLNDEIQEIKNSRVSFSITDDDEDVEVREKITKEKFDKEKNHGKRDYKENREQGPPKKKPKRNLDENQQNPKKMKPEGKENKQHGQPKIQQKKNFNETQDNSNKRKRQRGNKEGSGGEWADRRNAGREEARKKKDSEENWYLKRKNDREIHRLEKSVHA